jgi:uncharacterized membrane protein YGL010W
MQISTELQQWFEEYEKFHRHPTNKLTHYFGVPVILVTLVGMLSRVQFVEFENIRIDFANVVLVLGALWCIKLDWKFGLLFSFALVPSYFIGTKMSLALNFILFIAGWVLQLIGHYRYEKKSPALTKNLLQTLIGPMWIFAKVIRAK